VANFETVYNAFLGWPTLTKFMAIPHYAYLMLKMPRPRGVISIRGDAKWAYDCNKENYEIDHRLVAYIELQELKEASANPSPAEPIMPDSKISKKSIQSEETLSKQILLSTEEPSKVTHIGNSLDSK
jgi:hypothetical protein